MANIQENSKYIPRQIFPKIAKHLTENKEITLIIGPRQVGKTVLLHQLQKYLIQKEVNPQDIYYFNLDIIKDRDLFTDQTEFIQFLKNKSQKGKIYVFVDEAQKVKEAGVFFKGVYDSDLNVKLVLTGSSSLEIRAKINESLTGRKRIFYLLPFSFAEILRYHNPQLADLIEQKTKITAVEQKEILALFFSYCVYGGYPQVVTVPDSAEKEEFLREIFTSYVEKDIIGFLKVENENNFIKLVKLLATQVGNLINVSELSSLVQTDRQTVERYLLNLAKTFIIYPLQPFYSNPRQELVKANKIYFLDNGLRNLSLDNFKIPLPDRGDKGILLENAVLKELLILKYQQNFNLKFWRSKQKAEVDFIIEQGLEALPVEVKFDLSGDKLSASFLGFIKRYQPKRAIVVNLGYHGERKIGPTKIFFILPYELSFYL